MITFDVHHNQNGGQKKNSSFFDNPRKDKLITLKEGYLAFESEFKVKADDIGDARRGVTDVIGIVNLVPLAFSYSKLSTSNGKE